MNDTEILDRLRAILREHTSLKGEVTRETALLSNHVLDSMDFMNYLTAVETAYHCTISDDDLASRKLGVMGNMVDYLKERAV
jgi:acyl carrier protein